LPSPLPEVGKIAAGPPGTAEAVLASDNDNPAAAPNTGKALLRRFRFEPFSEFDMIAPSPLGGPSTPSLEVWLQPPQTAQGSYCEMTQPYTPDGALINTKRV